MKESIWSMWDVRSKIIELRLKILKFLKIEDLGENSVFIELKIECFPRGTDGIFISVKNGADKYWLLCSYNPDLDQMSFFERNYSNGKYPDLEKFILDFLNNGGE